MAFYVVTRDGSRYGPADLPLLQLWVNEGRLNPNSTLENRETGQRLLARDLEGLLFTPEAIQKADQQQEALNTQAANTQPIEDGPPPNPYAAKYGRTGTHAEEVVRTQTNQQQEGSLFTKVILWSLAGVIFCPAFFVAGFYLLRLMKNDGGSSCLALMLFLGCVALSLVIGIIIADRFILPPPAVR